MNRLLTCSTSAMSLLLRGASQSTKCACLCSSLHHAAAASPANAQWARHVQVSSTWPSAVSAAAQATGDAKPRPTWWQAAAAVMASAAAAAAAAAAGGSLVAFADTADAADTSSSGDGVSAGGKLLPLAMRQRIYFRYEKRIRDLSSLEKIYEYFATSHDQDGRKVMTAQDVVRALVPTYPPVGSTVERAGFLDGERGHTQAIQSAAQTIISFFDHNKDGWIGFDEFVLIVIALAVPEKDVEVVFDVMDLDGNGVIEEDEFLQVLQQLERRAGIQQKFVGRVGKHSLDADERQATHQLFTQQGGKGVSLDRFRAFLKRLQDGMLKLEFAHYDMQGRGSIKGCDFANSLVTAADIRVVDKFLDRVQNMPPELQEAQLTFKQFEDMASLRRNLHQVSFALDFCTQVERPLTQDDFSKLLQKTLGVKLAPAVLSIIFAVFSDSNGLLDGPCFVQTMKNRNKVPGYRKGQGLGVDSDADSSSSLLGWWNCIRNCSFAPSGHEALSAH